MSPPVPDPVLGPPAGDGIELLQRPQVLSWDAAGTWAQQRLIPYRKEIADRFAGVTGDALSFRLDCGLGPTGNLEAAGDLDNLLIPVVDALGRSRFVAAWGTKNDGTRSQLAVGPPIALLPESLDRWAHARVLTTVSPSSEAWKQQIADQIASAPPLPARGAAALIVAFRVGPGRAWHNLWKPAIDALGHVLGLPGPRRWHPRDGRIVELGLSSQLDPSLAWNVVIDYWWQQR
jgi:hypothetical protein